MGVFINCMRVVNEKQGIHLLWPDTVCNLNAKYNLCVSACVMIIVVISFSITAK